MGLGTAVVGSKTKSQDVAVHTQPYPSGITDGQVGPSSGHLIAFGFELQGETLSQYSHRSRVALKTVPLRAQA